MKKPKISLDSAKLQAFFLHHVEKVLLGVFVLLMLFLVWQGLTLKGLDKGSTPQGLIDISNATMTFIDDPTRWEKELYIERKVTMDIADQVEVRTRPNDPLAYLLP